MAKGTVSEQKKPVLDEQTLDKLLEAACVIQEQGDLRLRARKLAAADQGSQNRISTSKTPATPIAASAAAAASSFFSATPGAGKTAAEKTVSEKSEAEKSLAAGTVPTGPASISPISISKDSYTLTLAQIVETQQQILTRRLELENAMALVAQRAAEMTKAAGSAIAIVEAQTDAKKIDGKKLRYRAVSGLLTLAGGSEVTIERALCFHCLRSGEVIRGAA